MKNLEDLYWMKLYVVEILDITITSEDQQKVLRIGIDSSKKLKQVVDILDISPLSFSGHLLLMQKNMYVH